MDIRVSPHVLKVSAPTLCLHKLIMKSLSLQRVPVLGLVPVPKMPGSQTCGTDLLCHEDTGPIQFFYQCRLRDEDAIIHLLSCVYTHLHQLASTAGLMFF